MNDWKKTPLSNPSQEFTLYADMLAKDIASKKTWKRPATTIQAASTQRVLDMTDDELIAYRNRPTVDAQVRDEKGRVYVAERSVTAKEVVLESHLRSSRGNTFGDAISSGGGSSVSDGKSELAKSAFTCSPPAKEVESDLQRLINMVEMVKPEVKIEKPKKRLLNSVKEFFGIETKHEVDKNSPAYILFKKLGGKDEDFK